MYEMELRILDIDVENIREIVNKNNLACVKKEDQINNLFDFKDRRLMKNSGYARIRKIENLIEKKEHYYMTVKKLINNDKYKVMDEREMEICEYETGIKILEGLGLEMVESIKKYRESYQYKDTLIEIDINDEKFCPFPYLEIEGASESEIQEVVTLLGYEMKDTTADTIFKILKDRGIRI